MVYFKSSLALAPEYVNRWVVWNTGQGQWVTHILNEGAEEIVADVFKPEVNKKYTFIDKR